MAPILFIAAVALVPILLIGGLLIFNLIIAARWMVDQSRRKDGRQVFIAAGGGALVVILAYATPMVALPNPLIGIPLAVLGATVGSSIALLQCREARRNVDDRS